MLRIAILAAALLLPAAPLLSQTVQGRILEHSSDAPVRGVMVELRTDRGQPLGNSVTDSTGTFSFQLPGEGTYRLLGNEAMRRGFPICSANCPGCGGPWCGASR